MLYFTLHKIYNIIYSFLDNCQEGQTKLEGIDHFW